MTRFDPSRIAGLAQLQRFANSTGRPYYKNRNYDQGPDNHGHVSQLSPYIRHRMVAEWEIIHTADQACGETAQKFIDEVLWRTYWKGWLEHHPQTWRRYCDDVTTLTAGLNQKDRFANSYRDAVTGKTGVAPFDEWVRELIATGYLHNHARMWFASIWIFTLGLPWQLGADFFLRHLLDGDPASNTLSWRWVAGLHTRGKTYKAMQHNIQRYAGARFDQAALATLSQLSEHAPPCREPLPTESTPPGLHRMPAVQGRCGLLLVEDDLSAELPVHFDAVGALQTHSPLSLPAADLVINFKSQAIRDALRRARTQWPGARVQGDALDSSAVMSWVKDEQLDSLVVPYTPQGFTRDTVDPLVNALESSGVQVGIWLHDYDRQLWPYAQSGYFRFRDRARRELTELIHPPELPDMAQTG